MRIQPGGPVPDYSAGAMTRPVINTAVTLAVVCVATVAVIRPLVRR